MLQKCIYDSVYSDLRGNIIRIEENDDYKKEIKIFAFFYIVVVVSMNFCLIIIDT